MPEGVQPEIAAEVLNALVVQARDYALLIMTPDRRITVWSKGAEDITGWSAEEVQGESGDIIFVPEDLEAGEADGEASRAFETGRSENERWHVRKDGTRFWGSGMMLALKSPEGQVRTLVKVFKDATHRKEAEDELEQRVTERTTELHEALREADDFTYAISHDLRAPLRAIVSTSSILLEEAGPDLGHEARELLERQAHNANRLARLIDELLRLSRLWRLQLQPIDLDITEIATTVANEQAARWPDRRPVFRIQPNMRVRADENLVTAILRELVENALKFSPSGAVIDIGAEPTGSCTSFYVRDRGIGFDARQHDKMFRAFERLVRDAEYPGTGIGLAAVERMVRRHAGRIWAESSGDGATFRFTIDECEDLRP